ncbi:MAG: cyclic nucleotide-binding domain-containing protein [Chloroflexota bacterium]|nr:cyclic nucleotide-binding domain-containing protein [Chloroflexota bacterium]
MGDLMVDVEMLRAIPLFAGMKDDQLVWLSELIEMKEVKPGEMLLREGDTWGDFYVVLSGQVQVIKNAAGGDHRVVATAGAGDFMGEMSLLTGSPHSASARATQPTILVKVDPDTFSGMITSCSSVAAILLRTLAERTKKNEASARQDEKMAALGTLSAGFAHQLNNPASAATRAASQMRKTLTQINGYAMKFMYMQIDDSVVDFIAAFQRKVIEQASLPHYLEPLVQSDLEEAMSTWMDSHGLEDAWRIAPTFVAAGLTVEQLNEVTARLDDEMLCDLLLWIEGTLAGIGLLRSIEQSTIRISELIGSIKGYSYMDQAPLQEVDVHEGIENTLAVLGYKMTDYIRIIRLYDTKLPRILAYGGELNQVWTNVLDNAIDALGGKGEIMISTWRDGDGIVVEMADNGAGIPLNVVSRIWEPFFTTKDPATHPGLGLEVVWRLVKAHRGEISVKSQAGDTRFTVRLPLRFSDSPY